MHRRTFMAAGSALFVAAFPTLAKQDMALEASKRQAMRADSRNGALLAPQQ